MVGVINTLSDFLLFNIFLSLFHLPLLVANIFSVSIVMTLSLYLNRRFVFGTSNAAANAKNAAKFIIVTLIGLYAIQNSIIFIAIGFLNNMPAIIPDNHILQANIAKAIGVVGSATWNFLLYKFWVFKKPKETTIND